MFLKGVLFDKISEVIKVQVGGEHRKILMAVCEGPKLGVY